MEIRKIAPIFALLTVLLVAGCIADQTPSYQGAGNKEPQTPYQYVCPDGKTVVQNITLCPKATPIGTLNAISSSLSEYQIDGQLPTVATFPSDVAAAYNATSVHLLEWFSKTNPGDGDVILMLIEIDNNKITPSDAVTSFTKALFTICFTSSETSTTTCKTEIPFAETKTINGENITIYRQVSGTQTTMQVFWSYKSIVFWMTFRQPSTHIINPDDVLSKVVSTYKV